jgi:hypothetical protein
MGGVLEAVIVLGLWFLIQGLILPRLGVPT